MTYKNWDQEVKKLSATDRAIYKKAIKALMKWPVFKQELGWQVEQIGILGPTPSIHFAGGKS